MLTSTIVINKNEIDDFLRRLPLEAAAQVEETTNQILADASAAMSLPKSGNQYGDHIASAPGDAPAIDTRDLIDSGKATMTGPMTGEVTWESDHAGHMEFGTERVEPRPFASPAAEANRRALLDGLAKRLKKGS